MSTDNLTLVLHKLNDIRLEQTPIPKPGRDEVQLAVQSVGICGSDVHYWKHGKICNFIVKAPMILGHEPSGIVTQLGEGVTSLKLGDRVVIEPGVPCFTCTECKKGSYHLCPEMKFCATPPYDGVLRRYYVHHASFCHKIPDNMSLEEAALVEPLAVAVHACDRGRVSIGKTVLVTGSGPIGILNMLTAKAMGASKVYITDIAQNRLDFARGLGADGIFLCDTNDAEAFSKKILKSIEEVDIVIDCSGAEASLHLGFLIAKPGGTLVLVGMGKRTMTLPITEAGVKELDIKGVFRYVNCHPKAISLISSGKVDVKPLITHRFDLKDAVKAFEIASTGADGAIKILINCAK